MDKVVPPGGAGPAQPMNDEMKFNLLSFGDYSQKFSFDVGCGLPGRVYMSGICTWEQNVQIAPTSHFERCGGANQWGIKTVVGIPVASPNVGRIIVLLYSVHNRKKCETLASKLKNEFTNLMPTPRWKLVVDVSPPKVEDTPPKTPSQQSMSTTKTESDSSTQQPFESPLDSVIRLLGNEIPLNPSCPTSPQHHVMSLRLLLLRGRRSAHEEEIVKTILGSHSSYSKSGRPDSDIAVMLARDFMFLTQSQQGASRETQQSQQYPQYQNNCGMTHQIQYSQFKQTSQAQTSVPHVSPPISSMQLLNDSIQNQRMSYPLLDIFRPDSPALTPIIPLEDSLSIVSN